MGRRVSHDLAAARNFSVLLSDDGGIRLPRNRV